MSEANNKPCDCLNRCGDDPGLKDGRVQQCAHFNRMNAPADGYRLSRNHDGDSLLLKDGKVIALVKDLLKHGAAHGN